MNDKIRDQLREWLISEDVTLKSVIDEVIEINGLVGVGLISLADELAYYITHHKSYSSDSDKPTEWIDEIEHEESEYRNYLKSINPDQPKKYWLNYDGRKDK